MSLGYNDRLLKGIDRGVQGKPELVENPEKVALKVKQLVKMIQDSEFMIVHTGAGISTACGVPDFRGPQGVWTREAEGKPPPQSVNFAEAIPSLTHMALVGLYRAGILKHVVSQNVDGLHLKSGIPHEALTELHGNVFMEECITCKRQFYGSQDVKGMGLKPTGRLCVECKGPLRDLTYDWDTELSETEMSNAILVHKKADLVLVLGSSLIICPAANMPLKTIRKNGKAKPGQMVIVNLQKTPLDSKAHLRIHCRVDDVFSLLMPALGLTIPMFSPTLVPPWIPSCLTVDDLAKRRCKSFVAKPEEDPLPVSKHTASGSSDTGGSSKRARRTPFDPNFVYFQI